MCSAYHSLQGSAADERPSNVHPLARVRHSSALSQKAHTKLLILTRAIRYAGEGEGVAGNVAEALHGLGDLERGITRSLHGTAAPAEFYNVMRRMASIAPKLGVLGKHCSCPQRAPSDKNW